MTRAGSYGQSFALKHLAAGRADEALAAAAAALAADPDDPEPMLDRSHILLELGRHEEAFDAIVAAQALDQKALVLDDAAVDDMLFSTLVAWASAVAPKDPKRAVELIERYGQVVPRSQGQGSHADEAARWVRRFQGHVETWVKPTDA
jgi:tetratricopeptide (TPR) repeat protein